MLVQGTSVVMLLIIFRQQSVS